VALVLGQSQLAGLGRHEQHLAGLVQRERLGRLGRGGEMAARLALFFLACAAVRVAAAADADPDAGGLVLATPPTPPGFDPYAILGGVSASATEPELRAAARRARKAAKAERPAMLAAGVTDKEFEEAMGLIDIAYDILADAALKQKWDLEHPRLDFRALEAEEEEKEAKEARKAAAAAAAGKGAGKGAGKADL